MNQGSREAEHFSPSPFSGQAPSQGGDGELLFSSLSPTLLAASEARKKECDSINGRRPGEPQCLPPEAKCDLLTAFIPLGFRECVPFLEPLPAERDSVSMMEGVM